MRHPHSATLATLALTALALAPLPRDAAAACAAPVGPDAFDARLDAAEARFAALDGEGFAQAMDGAAFVVPCVDGVVPPAIAAHYHRLQGLTLYASRNEERARQAFAAARAVDPLTELPESLVPPGHAIRELWATADPETPSRAVAPPVEGALVFDGATGDRRPEGRPSLVQVVDAAGAVRATEWIEPTDPMPPYSPVPHWSDPDVRRRGVLPPAPLLAGGGAAAVVGGVLYGIASARAAAFEGPQPATADLDDLRASRRVTNTLVGGAAVAGGLSLASVSVAVVAGRW